MPFCLSAGSPPRPPATLGPLCVCFLDIFVPPHRDPQATPVSSGGPFGSLLGIWAKPAQLCSPLTSQVEKQQKSRWGGGRVKSPPGAAFSV